jgi:hypothetical protein
MLTYTFVHVHCIFHAFPDYITLKEIKVMAL